MKTKKYSLELGAACLLAGLLVLVAGCSKESAESLTASAKANFEKREYRAAAIQAKNALEKDPNSGEMRFLLGKALLEVGDAATAEVEFRKALELRHSRDEVVPMLMRALVASGQTAKAIEEAPRMRVISGTANAEIFSWLAAAHMARNDGDGAKKALAEAFKSQANNPTALLYSAIVKLAERDVAGALATIDAVIASAPANAEAHKLKGDLLLMQERAELAVASYRKAVEVRPDLLKVQAALVYGMLAQANFDAKSPMFPDVIKEAEALQARAPNLPQTLSLQTQIAFARGNLPAAREAVLRLLRVAPEATLSLQLAGAIEYSMGSYTQAEAYLVKALSAAPDAMAIRRWLVLNRLGAGQASKAIEALQPVLAKIEADPDMLLLAGQAYLQVGDAKKAEVVLAKAARLQPNDPRKRTALAMARLAGGDANTALADLEQVSSWDKGTIADMALIASRLQRDEPERALAAIERLEKKLPNNPQPAEMRGRVLLAKKDLAGARKSFERSLAVNPVYMPAVTLLAQMDVDEGKLDLAAKRYDAVLAADPRNLPALVALAAVKASLKAPADEVVGLYSRAINSDATDLRPRVGLISYYFDAKEPKKALSAAQDAVAANPNRSEVLILLGQAQRASGEINQALLTYNKVIVAQPDLVNAYLPIAELNAANKNYDAANEALLRALKIKPDMVDVQRALASLNVFRGKEADALVIARQVQKQRPRDAVGYDIEGDVHASRKAWGEAAEAYRLALRNGGTAGNAIKLHRAISLSGNTAEADRVGGSWLKEHPKDAMFYTYLGEVALLGNKYAQALDYFKVVDALSPNQALIVNNLAMALLGLKSPEALSYAEKANKLAPNNSDYMDTLALALADKGETARAVELFAEALKISPLAHGVRINYARTLIQAGKRGEARKELEELGKLGEKFPGQMIVAKMLREL